MGNNNDQELFFNELMILNPSIAYEFNIIRKLKSYENYLDCNYINKINELLNKYKNSNNYDLRNAVRLELKKKLIFNENLIPLKSFENPILNFEYEFNNNKLIKHDFDNFVENCINNMREGIKKKITIPKIICKKLINQLENTKFKKILHFLKKEYYNNCINKIGLCYLKNGKEYYKILIKEYCNGCYMSPKKIHNYGKKLVTSFKKLDKNYYTSKKNILKDANKYYHEIFKKILPKYFHYIPIKNKCKIKIVPKSLEKTNNIAYYDPNDETFYLNMSEFYTINKNSLKTLLMHETDPGHHYQYSYLNHYKKLPLYKINAIQNESLVEGWALYAEKLDNNNYYEYEQLRVIRLVVDTGINYYGWSYNKAFNYMKKNLSIITDKEIKEEIERYICIPGQALAYKLGENFILKLKKLFINKYKIGNIKDFHDFLLEDGIVSFKYLQNKLQNNSSKIL